MANFTVSIAVSGGTVSYNSPTVTVGTGTNTIFWVPGAGASAINSVNFAGGGPGGGTVASSGGTFSVIDVNTLTSGASTTPFAYSAVVQPSSGSPITGADPEIVNVPPGW